MANGFTELQRDALCLTQALLGVVSDNFRLVTIERSARKIIIRIVLAVQCDEDVEEIDDMETEFEALTPGPIDFSVEISVSKEPIILEPPSHTHMNVFRKRE